VLSSVFPCVIFDPAEETEDNISLLGDTESLIPLDLTLGDRELTAPSPSLFNLSFEDDFDRDFRDRNKSVNFFSLALYFSLGLAPSSEGGGSSACSVEEEGAAKAAC